MSIVDEIDNKILKYQQKLIDAKAELAADERLIERTWETNQSYCQIGSGPPTNLNTSSLDTIVSLLADLVLVRDSIKQSMELLGLIGDFNIQGYSFEAWLNDFKRRVAIIQVKSRKDKVAKLEAALNELMSPEARRLQQFKAIESELDDL